MLVLLLSRPLVRRHPAAKAAFEPGSDLHSEPREDGSHLRRLEGTRVLVLQQRPANSQQSQMILFANLRRIAEHLHSCTCTSILSFVFLSVCSCMQQCMVIPPDPRKKWKEGPRNETLRPFPFQKDENKECGLLSVSLSLQSAAVMSCPFECFSSSLQANRRQWNPCLTPRFSLFCTPQDATNNSKHQHKILPDCCSSKTHRWLVLQHFPQLSTANTSNSERLGSGEAKSILVLEEDQILRGIFL